MIFQNAAFASSISVNKGLSILVQFAVSAFAISAAGLPIMLKSSLGGLILSVLDASYQQYVQYLNLHPWLCDHSPTKINLWIIHWLVRYNKHGSQISGSVLYSRAYLLSPDLTLVIMKILPVQSVSSI